MDRRWSATVVLSSLVLSLAGIAVARRMTMPQSVVERHVIQQPEHWVPFEADAKVTTPGVVDIYGHYYRSADGSTRLESGTRDRRDRVISIQNYQLRITYIKGPDGWWSFPQRPRDAPYLPRHALNLVEEMVGLNKLPAPVYVNSEVQLIAKPGTLAEDGAFAAYRYSSSKGDTYIFVPELNFFPMLKQFASTGQREAFFNIRLDVNPEAALFEPPQGAVVVERQPPMSAEPADPGVQMK